MRRSVGFALLVTAALTVALLSSCGSSYKLSRQQVSASSAWPFHRGDLAAQAAFPQGRFNGKLTVLWEQEDNGKPSGPLTIYHGALVYPSTRKKIEFYDTMSGKSLGRIKTKGPIPTGLVVEDSLAFFALSPNRQQLYCVNLVRNDQVWKRRVKDIPGGSIIVENRLMIADTDGILTAYNAVTGDEEWTFSGRERFQAPPSFRNGAVFQPGDDGTIYVLSVDDGSEIARVGLDGPLVSAVAAADPVVAADMLGNVYGVEYRDSLVRWKTELGSPLWTAPAIAGDQVLIGLGRGELVALDIETGDVNWRYDTKEVVKGSPIAVGEYAIVGTLGGHLYVVDLARGQIVDQRGVDGAIVQAPVSDGDRVFVATESGRIICFGESHEKSGQSAQRISSGDESQ